MNCLFLALLCLVGCLFVRLHCFYMLAVLLFSAFSVCAGLYKHTVLVICFVHLFGKLAWPGAVLFATCFSIVLCVVLACLRFGCSLCVSRLIYTHSVSFPSRSFLE